MQGTTSNIHTTKAHFSPSTSHARSARLTPRSARPTPRSARPTAKSARLKPRSARSTGMPARLTPGSERLTPRSTQSRLSDHWPTATRAAPTSTCSAAKRADVQGGCLRRGTSEPRRRIENRQPGGKTGRFTFVKKNSDVRDSTRAADSDYGSCGVRTRGPAECD